MGRSQNKHNIKSQSSPENQTKIQGLMQSEKRSRQVNPKSLTGTTTKRNFTRNEKKYKNVKQGLSNQKSNLNLQNLQIQNNEKMEEQRSLKGLPPFAQLCAQIILKIAQFPKRQDLQKSSLVDQICSMIKQFENNHINKKQEEVDILKQKINRLNQLFIDGIVKKQYFSQEKFEQTSEKKIIFNPTHIVTGQIFRQLINKQFTKKYNISFGHHGIGRKFGYYLYHELSNLFIAETLELSEQVKQYLKQKGIRHIPKLISPNMQLIIQNFDSEEYLRKLKVSIKQQCPQVPANIKNMIDKVDYKIFVSRICQFYDSKDVQVYLLVDQIDNIASTFKKFHKQKNQKRLNQQKIQIQKEKQTQQQQKKVSRQQYYIAHKINNIRIELVKCQHCQIIYYSSVNCANFFVSNLLQQHPPPDYNSFLKAAEQIKIHPDFPHQPSFAEHRILYLEIMKFDSSIWSLADTIIFEMKINKKLFKTNQQQKYWRSEIFQFLKRGNIYSITSLMVRLIFRNILGFFDDLVKFLHQFQIQIQANLKNTAMDNLRKFKEKIPDQLVYLTTVDKIFHKLIQFEQEQKIQDLTFKFDLQQTVRKCLSFFDDPIYIKNDISLGRYFNVDRNIFLTFDCQSSIKSYLCVLQQFTIKSFENWENEDSQQIEQKVRKICEKYENKISKKLQKNYKNIVIVFTLLPPRGLIELIKPQLQEIKKLNLEQAKAFFINVNQNRLGKHLKTYFIQYLEKAGIIEIKNQKCNLAFKNVSIKQSIEMKQLPKLNKCDKLIKKIYEQQQKYVSSNKSNKISKRYHIQNKLKQRLNNPPKFEHLSSNTQLQYKQFINQFLNKQRQSGYYLHSAIRQKSKSIDFAIQEITNNQAGFVCHLYLFQVTVVANITKISQKIQTFLEGYVYAADYLLQSTKQLRKREKLFFKINFVLIGVNSNEEIMKNSVNQQNQSMLFKYITNMQKENEKEQTFNSVLNKIMWININKMNLPKIGNFQTLEAIRQTLLSRKIDFRYMQNIIQDFSSSSQTSSNDEQKLRIKQEIQMKNTEKKKQKSQQSRHKSRTNNSLGNYKIEKIESQNN